MAIKHVCSDGAAFADYAEAEKHERELVTMSPLFMLIDAQGDFETYEADMRDEVYEFITRHWAEIKKIMEPVQANKSPTYTGPSNRDRYKNCTGYDRCSDICDDCKADDEDRQDK